jgi:L-2-hydroxyglutarate oxidase
VTTPAYDVGVIGGGIVGLGTAYACLRRFPGVRLVVLEKEPQLATHQTGRNSGVIHSGIYYRPGSLKAKLCVNGARILTEFCDTKQIPYQRYGKVIVAVEPSELPALEALYERGLANGVPGLSRIDPPRLRELEPNVRGIQALHLPHVAIVDFAAVAKALAQDIEQAGGTLLTATRLTQLREGQGGWRLGTTRGDYDVRFLINCAGLHADRLARMAGDRFAVRIVPFRGEYFTKTLEGGVHVGPNAVLALKREGYTRMDISWRDCLELVMSPGFWRMAQRHWRSGMQELARSWSKRAFLRAAQRLVPSLRVSDLLPSPSGVRAQAVGVDGALLDDFVLRDGNRALHVYNAPSPAATAALTIGETIAEHVSARLR